MKLWLRQGMGDVSAAVAELISESLRRAEADIGAIMPGKAAAAAALKRRPPPQLTPAPCRRLHAPAARPAGALEPLAVVAHVRLGARAGAHEGRNGQGRGVSPGCAAMSLPSLIARACADAPRRRRALAAALGRAAGSGALAGHAFGLDRWSVASSLGFPHGPTVNSMDSVSDRDAALDAAYACSMLNLQLSRWAEDLILYSTAEFGCVPALVALPAAAAAAAAPKRTHRCPACLPSSALPPRARPCAHACTVRRFVRLSDAYCTGSSLMPQKRNPDALELIRGKAGRTCGRLSGLMMTVKGLPSTYNKDLQEDKEQVFECVDTALACARIAQGVLATLEVRPQRMAAALSHDVLATDLVRRCCPRCRCLCARISPPGPCNARRITWCARACHSARRTRWWGRWCWLQSRAVSAGAAVQPCRPLRSLRHRNCACTVAGTPLNEVPLDRLRVISPAFEEDVGAVWDFAASVERRDAVGGTSERAVREQIARLTHKLHTLAPPASTAAAPDASAAAPATAGGAV